MNRPLLSIAFFAAATAALVAQQASQSSPYSGVSTPPPDDQILTDSGEPIAKPPAGQPMNPQPAAPAQQQATMPAAPAYAPSNPSNSALVTGTDDGLVQIAQPTPGSTMPSLSQRPYVPDPDGDIVHPQPLGPGELREGTRIRVRLMDDLSSTLSEKGQPFHSKVSADVEENGVVVIPAGSMIDGTVAQVSTGRFGGRGSILLHPEHVTLPDGAQYRLFAMVAQTPMSRTHVGPEGMIKPNDNIKRDSLEYAGGVGTGVVAGAYLGGPVGALAGGLVGAAVVTTHLLVSHPQAHLDTGDVLVLTLTQQMHMTPANTRGE